MSQEPRMWSDRIAEEDVLGQRCKVYADRRRLIPELLLDARRFADSDYLVEGDRRLTFAQHETLVRATARFFTRLGVLRGDRVMILGANAIEWVVAFWGALAADATVVLGNAWWSEVELSHALVTVCPKVVVVDERRRPMLPPSVVTVPYRDLAALEARAQTNRSETGQLRGEEDGPAVIVFTSGTTGSPKGATLSHRAIISNMQSILVAAHRLPAQDAPPAPQTRSLLSLPLFHIGGVQQIVTPMLTGGLIVFANGAFDPAKIARLVDSKKITLWSAVPTMVSRFLDHTETTGNGANLSTLRTVAMGGSPVPETLRRRVRQILTSTRRGASVSYGLTEAGGFVATASGGELENRAAGCVGRIIDVADVRIAATDDSGIGEILVRSPGVMIGYWGEGNSGVLTYDRWLHTGDLGHVDDDRYLYVTGREKDVIIRGGENVAAPHVENRLLQHPDVAEVAVVGLPHADLGEEVGAVVVTWSDASLDPSEFAAFAAEALAYFEVPSAWWFRGEPLPLNATGKVMKRTLVAEWLRRRASA